MVSTPPRRLKVARIIARLNIGGPARQVCLLHERLRDEFDTVLITGQLDSGEGDMSSLLSSERGVYRVGAMSRPIRLWSDVKSLLEVFRILRREKPDIVHTHTAKAGTIGRIAAILAGVPICVHTYHGHVFHGYFSAFLTRIFITIERILNRFTTAVVAISESQKKDLVETYRVAPAEKVHVIHTGFDFLPPQEPKKASPFTIAWAGRLTAIKGIDVLADVIALAAEELPDAHFLIAGDGPERSRLEQLQTTNFTLLGWQSDLNSLWAKSDVALLTSVNEGTPASLIEAMAAGKPFVATNVGGTADLAVPPLAPGDGFLRAENGFLTDRSAEAIVRCLKTFANDSAIRSAMGKRGAEFVRTRHSSVKLEENIRGLYRELAAEMKLN